MSLHRSLKTKPSALNQHRNVLTRTERIAKLTETERFISQKTSPMGLLKVANRFARATKKPKKEAAEGEGEAGAAPVAGAAPATAAPAAAGKSAAGAKSAAGGKPPTAAKK
jgi:small basic protein (TIGR04137 family)